MYVYATHTQCACTQLKIFNERVLIDGSNLPKRKHTNKLHMLTTSLHTKKLEKVCIHTHTFKPT